MKIGVDKQSGLTVSLENKIQDQSKDLLSQCPGLILPKEFCGKKLACKTTPWSKKFDFSTFLIYIIKKVESRRFSWYTLVHHGGNGQ